MSFERALAHVFGVEGGFSDDPNDSGGATKYGITEAVARANGYAGAMQDLSPDWARRIYRAVYWDALSLDDVAARSAPIALELFDTAVNCDTGVAGTFLQRSLNALNRQQALYPDLKVDGAVGPTTVRAFRSYLDHRGREGAEVLLKALNCLQGARYVELAERREKDEAFVYGWLKNRVAIP